MILIIVRQRRMFSEGIAEAVSSICRCERAGAHRSSVMRERALVIQYAANRSAPACRRGREIEREQMRGCGS